MNDPPRFLENSGSTLTTALLRAGHEEEPSDVLLERTLGSLGAAAAISSLATAANETASALSGGSAATKTTASLATWIVTAKWVGIGTLGGVVTLTAATQLTTAPRAPVAQHAAPQIAETAPPGRAVHQVARSSIEPPLDRRPDPDPPMLSPQPEVPGQSSHRDEELRPRAAEPSPAFATSAPSDPSMPLAAELALVDRGWAALRSHQFANTLSVLESYERQFPRLSLQPEVLYLRMEAESQLGHASNAEGYARRILASYSNSPHAARARVVVGDHR